MKNNTTKSKALAVIAAAALLSFGSLARAAEPQGTQPAEHPGFWNRLFHSGADDAPVPGPAMHAETGASAPVPQPARIPMEKPAVMGTLASVSGTTLAVTGKDGTSYSVNAASATVMKGLGAGSVASTVSAIPTGDTLIVMGTVSGTNVTASRIVFGLGGAMMKGGPGIETEGEHAAGRPVLGTVASVSGNSVTLTGKDGKTYAADVSAAIIVRGGEKETAMTAADIKAGDTLLVFGTLSDSAIAATKIIDGPKEMGDEGEQQRASVSGTVTAVVGTTMTVKAADGTEYTVDATSAAFVRAGDKETATTIAGVLVGDAVVVDGTVTGTDVVAARVLDGARPLRYAKPMAAPVAAPSRASAVAPAPDASATAPETVPLPEKPSFMRKVGAILGHLKFW